MPRTCLACSHPDRRCRSQTCATVVALLSTLCLLAACLRAQGTSGSGASKMTGTVASLGCAGFVPAPCARSDRTVTQLGSAPSGNVDGTWTDNGPQVNVPWINDFGEREVRATDGVIPGGKPVGGGNYGPETWWTNYWSVYDSSVDGYYFYFPIGSSSGTDRLYTLNPTTMTVSSVCPTTWTSCEMPYAGSWSLITPGLMYYSTGEDLCSYNYDSMSGAGTCSDDVGTLVFNFSTCPDYGTYYSGSIFLDGVSYGDEWLEASFGSTAMAAYAINGTDAGNCYWYSTKYGLAGGSNLTTQNATIAAGVAPTLSSGNLTPTTGTGTLPSGTYYVEMTRVTQYTSNAIYSGSWSGGVATIYSDDDLSTAAGDTITIYDASNTAWDGTYTVATVSGQEVTFDVASSPGTWGTGYVISNSVSPGFESTPSAQASATLSATGEIAISGQTLASDFYTRNWSYYCNVYVSTTSGAETLQISGQSCTGTIEIAQPLVASVSPPTLNAAGYELHGSDAGSGAWFNAEASGTNAYVPWQMGTANTILCVTKSSDQCEGHESDGNISLFYNLQSPNTGGVMSPYDVALSPNADPTESNYEHLIPAGPPTYNFYAAIPSAGCNISDYHSNWTYDNLTDTLPVMWSDFVEPFVGMVEQSGTVSTTADSTTVTGSGTSFSSSWVGEYIWIGTGGTQGTGLGVGAWAQIASVQSSTQLTLAGNAPLTVSGYSMWTYYYPLMGIQCTWDHEIDMVSSSGNGTVWRFAHNRASGLQNQLSNADSSYQALSMPVCSPDGKYCLWATDWANANGQGQLGTQTGFQTSATGCSVSCAWKADTTYDQYQEVIDSNGNEEMATETGESGSTEPSWPTTVGDTVVDGGTEWHMEPGCNTPQSISVAFGGPVFNAGMCRTDVFIVEMR